MRSIQSTDRRRSIVAILVLTTALTLSLVLVQSTSAASVDQMKLLTQKLADNPEAQTSPHTVAGTKNTIDIERGLRPQPQSAQSRMSTFSLQDNTYVLSQTTSNKSPVIYGAIPSYCGDVGVLVYADTANLSTGEGVFGFFSESNQIYLETDYTSEYRGVWYLDLQQNGLGLINGAYNVFVSSKCGYTSYSSPLYSDIHLDALLVTPISCDNACTPVYRFYNTQNGAHFYTSSGNEKRNVLYDMKQYRYEGIVNFAKTAAEAGTMPVHRFYNKQNGTHFYTGNQAEATAINNNQWQTYRYEGVAYHSYYTYRLDATPVHRFYKFKQGVHFYTSNQAEATAISNNQWQTYRYEGISYYSIASE